MKKMKCLLCGCERDFVEIQLAKVLILRDAGDYEQSVKSYACCECGFVQLFDKEQVDKKLAQMKEDEEYNKKVEEHMAKIAAVEKEIEETNKIINDENQTVKAVNEAKLKLTELKRKLEGLKMRYPQKNKSNNHLFRIG